MRTPRRLLTLALLALPLASVDAQLAELTPGTKVRLRAPTAVAGQLKGLVIARTNDSVTVTRENATPVAIPLAALTSLEISRGKNRLRGAGKGALWGAGSASVLFALIPADDCAAGESGPACETLSVGESVALGAIGGAIWGVLIGALVGSEHWERAILPSQVTVAPAPRGRGLQLGLRLPAAR